MVSPNGYLTESADSYPEQLPEKTRVYKFSQRKMNEIKNHHHEEYSFITDSHVNSDLRIIVHPATFMVDYRSDIPSLFRGRV